MAPAPERRTGARNASGDVRERPGGSAPNGRRRSEAPTGAPAGASNAGGMLLRLKGPMSQVAKANRFQECARRSFDSR